MTAGGTDGSLRIWQLNPTSNRYEQLQSVSSSDGSSVDTVVLSADESTIVGGYGNGSLAVLSKSLTGSNYRNFQLIANGHAGGVTAVDIASDNSKIVSTGLDNSTGFWTRGSNLMPFNLNRRLTEAGASVDIDLTTGLAIGSAGSPGAEIAIYTLVVNCSEVPNSNGSNINPQ